MENETIADVMDERTVDNRAVFNRILAAMGVCGMKASDVTNALGLHSTMFSNWKRGKGTSYMKYIDSIAEAINAPTDYLLHGADNEELDAGQCLAALDEKGIAPKDIARLLGITPYSVYNWRTRKEIPAKHGDSILYILNSTRSFGDKQAHNQDKEGIFEKLKQKRISKTSLAEHLGISKGAVYNWKGDQAIPDKYVDSILELIEEEQADEIGIIESNLTEGSLTNEAPMEYKTLEEDSTDIQDSKDISAFIANINTYIQNELQDFSDNERKTCLSELDMVLRLSLKQIKLFTKLGSSLGI